MACSIEHQPRERAVLCRLCSHETFSTDMVCGPCLQVAMERVAPSCVICGVPVPVGMSMCPTCCYEVSGE